MCLDENVPIGVLRGLASACLHENVPIGVLRGLVSACPDENVPIGVLRRAAAACLDWNVPIADSGSRRARSRQPPGYAGRAASPCDLDSTAWRETGSGSCVSGATG